MNAPGKRMNDREAHYAKQLPSESVLNFNNIQCDCTMHTSQVLLDYGARSDKHVPYLHFIGEVRRVEFPQEMKPYMHGIDALTFPEDMGLQTDVFYKFNRKELTEMVKKGYFDEGFQMPDIFYDNDFELPMSCNLMMVQPDRAGTPPIIFVGLNNPREMEFTAESSGYDLGSYFEHVPESEYKAPELLYGQPHAEPEYDAEFEDDMFADAYEAPAVEEQVEQGMPETETEDDFEIRRLMEQYSQIEANVDARKGRTRADIDKAIQVASNMTVEETVEPEVTPVEDEADAVDSGYEQDVMPEFAESDVAIVEPPVDKPIVSEPVAAESDESEFIDDDIFDEVEGAEADAEPVEVSAADSESEIIADGEDEEEDNKSAKVAKRIAIIEDNLDANQEEVVRKSLPAQFEDVAAAAGSEFEGDDFGDVL